MKNTSQTSKKNNLGTRVSYGVILCIILAVVVSTIWETIQFYRTINALKSLHPRSIRELRIYPRTTVAHGNPVTFSPPEILIDEFVHALKDIRAYRGSPKGILSLDHEWFVEIETTDGHVIQMRCHLPANRREVVHGSFEQAHYGNFQSQGLFRWYQQYSHWWLGENRQDEGISLESSE